MFMIVCPHINSHEGLLSKPQDGWDVYYFLAWTMNATCITSVNVFVLLSGHFLAEQKFLRAKVFGLIESGKWYQKRMNNIDLSVNQLGEKLYLKLGGDEK